MTKEASANIQKQRAIGPVRITIPARIAYSPDELKKSIASIAEQIGHPRCFSGADCFFQMEREFVLDRAGKATPVAGPDLAPWHAQDRAPDPSRVSVGLSSGVKYDLNKALTAVDKVIDLIGAHPCISGFDVLFRDELNWVVVNEKLEGQRFGKQF